MKIKRRTLLQGIGLGSLGLFPGLSLSRAATEPDRFLVIVSFAGGWDQLLGLDPRDQTEYPRSGSVIDPGYTDLAEEHSDVAQVLTDTGGTGVIQAEGSSLTLGPSAASLAPLADDLCVIRGINMDTLTHASGRRYFTTGKFPRGQRASGSSLSTWVTSQLGALSPIPNLVFGMETFNEGLPAFSSGLQIADGRRMVESLTTQAPPLEDAAEGAIAKFAKWAGCRPGPSYAGATWSTYQSSRERADELTNAGLGAQFQFLPVDQIADPELRTSMEGLYRQFSITDPSRQLSTPNGKAMIVGQVLRQRVSQSVSISLTGSLDTHQGSDWVSDQPVRQRQGFEALAALIQFLKLEGIWSRTTLLCFSDFARTPYRNGTGGRDHHLASSCLLAGQNIRGNFVMGATDNVQMQAQPIDPSTGRPDQTGIIIRPPDIHRTLLEAMGLPYDNLENQSPRRLSAVLT